jgi:hypothetical protein
LRPELGDRDRLLGKHPRKCELAQQVKAGKDGRCDQQKQRSRNGWISLPLAQSGCLSSKGRADEPLIAGADRDNRRPLAIDESRAEN